MPGLTRRSLLRASPALLAPVALVSCGTEVLSAPETPVMTLYREREAMMDDLSGPEGEALSGDDFNAACNHEGERIEALMEREPPTDLRDLAAKVAVLSGEGCFGLSDAMTLERAAIVGRDVARMPRCLFKEAARPWATTSPGGRP